MSLRHDIDRISCQLLFFLGIRVIFDKCFQKKIYNIYSMYRCLHMMCWYCIYPISVTGMVVIIYYMVLKISCVYLMRYSYSITIGPNISCMLIWDARHIYLYRWARQKHQIDFTIRLLTKKKKKKQWIVIYKSYDNITMTLIRIQC